MHRHYEIMKSGRRCTAPAKADHRSGRHTEKSADVVARAAGATAGGGAAAAPEMGPLLPLEAVTAGGAAAAAARFAYAAGSGQCTAEMKTGGRCSAPAKAAQRRGRHAHKAEEADAVARVGAGATSAVAGAAALAK